MRKAERKKVDAFEMWRWRRVTRVSRMERKTNECARKHQTRMDTGMEGGT